MAEKALKCFGAGYSVAKPMFPNRLSVKTEGHSLHVVTFQSDHKDTQILFHFDESYPSRIPKIKVSSSTLTEDQKCDLSEFLHRKGKAEEYSNSQTLPLLVEHAGKWLQENYGKKTSEVKRWNRNEIREESWQLQACPETASVSSPDPREITTSTQRETTPTGRKQREKNGNMAPESWADSIIQLKAGDDEVTSSDWNVVESRSKPIKVSKKESQKVKFTLDSVPKLDVPADSRRANYFVAIRCTNGEIGDAVTEVVKKMLSVDSVYQPICYNRNEVHVTLTTVALHSDSDVNKAVKALQDARDVLIDHAPTSCLRISGIDEFQGSKVVFGKVSVEEDILLLRRVVRWAFEKGGIYPKDNFDYHPHMTLAKVNMGFTKKTGLRNISRVAYESLLDYRFGQQGVKGIHLCQMGHERRDDGFYVCPTQIDFKK
ncbi:A-kinase anchor protein 7-like [Haliotis cracherodii]|uniref:A-kinase anchor protein 7-like n=1 Tax=Haliotis cracherodii TaxID=6455 RepID=UPI0039EBABBF